MAENTHWNISLKTWPNWYGISQKELFVRLICIQALHCVTTCSWNLWSHHCYAPQSKQQEKPVITKMSKLFLSIRWKCMVITGCQSEVKFCLVKKKVRIWCQVCLHAKQKLYHFLHFYTELLVVFFLFLLFSLKACLILPTAPSVPEKVKNIALQAHRMKY